MRPRRDPPPALAIARDTIHQNQWIAAIAELEADGLETTPAPSTFPHELGHQRVSYQFWNCSVGTESAEGLWARGETSDGKGAFEYVERPEPLGPEPELAPVDPRTWGTPPMPVAVSTGKAT